MLTDLFPKGHARYSSLRLLGPILDGFARWLHQQGYPRIPLRCHVRTTRRLEAKLRRRGCRSLGDVTRDRLRACGPRHSQTDANLASTVRLLERYLGQQGHFAPPGPPSRIESKLAAYELHLQRVRGLARKTIAQHRFTASQFLQHLSFERDPSRLAQLTASHVESFVQLTGQRLERASLQHTVAQLRAFLRYLVLLGEIHPGLDAQIDTPRVYRLEQLPRALPWETVQAFLRGIKRTTPLGRRDYAIFLLIATYGLRASEVVALKFEDIEWRAGRLRVAQRKTAAPLLLPLTDTVASSLLDYLRLGRPPSSCRELFVRHRAPAGVLKPTAVTEAFQAWSRRGGLKIPFQGPHSLRHSYAVRLLRQGTTLKTIGDLLGHRSAESTCVYLRLAVEDLREVALPLPNEGRASAAPEAQP